MGTVIERFQAIVVDHLNVDPDKVVGPADFIEDLGADSLDVVELVMALEEEFGVQIPDDAAEGIATVQQAIDYITAQIGS
ncbi:acyl carrier protein [Pseudomonas sp. SWRI81]|uniref:acyl carrier protein n=1 Tax=Pseudomonas sp. SWRI81 TaxID=2745505 RepID=UPI001646125B|nr:acyl carrier protein [Pseudomonas sp. SWRI81]MBC3270995.1 acyl carrier protein [Pseudomonas sp. SWRI81]